MRDGGGGHWLVRLEWHPAGWSVFQRVLIFPCTIKSRSSLLAPAHPGGPGKRAVKWLSCGGGQMINKLQKFLHTTIKDLSVMGIMQIATIKKGKFYCKIILKISITFRNISHRTY